MRKEIKSIRQFNAGVSAVELLAFDLHESATGRERIIDMLEVSGNLKESQQIGLRDLKKSKDKDMAFFDEVISDVEALYVKLKDYIEKEGITCNSREPAKELIESMIEN